MFSVVTCANEGAAVSILLVEDHALVRRGLAREIESQPGWRVCAEVSDVPAAMAAIKEHRPDLVVTDLGLPGIGGMDFIKQLGESHPRLRVLVVSMHDEDIYAPRVLRAGAKGYVSKEARPEVFIQAIQSVLAGKVFVTPEIAMKMVYKITGTSEPRQTPLDQLTDRELEVYELVGRGLASKQIAERLSLSSKTVDAHRDNIKKKLGLVNITQLIQSATQWVFNRDHRTSY